MEEETALTSLCTRRSSRICSGKNSAVDTKNDSQPTPSKQLGDDLSNFHMLTPLKEATAPVSTAPITFNLEKGFIKTDNSSVIEQETTDVRPTVPAIVLVEGKPAPKTKTKNNIKVERRPGDSVDKNNIGNSAQDQNPRVAKPAEKSKLSIKKEEMDLPEQDKVPKVEEKRSSYADVARERTVDTDPQKSNIMSKPASIPAIKASQRETRVREREPNEEGNRKRTRQVSASSSATGSSPRPKRANLEQELDAAVIARRQKQIDYGKNTLGYDAYLQAVPKNKRTKQHPRTPPKHLKYSRRAWDGLVRIWRQELHNWDPKEGEGAAGEDMASESESNDPSLDESLLLTD